jgi:hypothetical protein
VSLSKINIWALKSNGGVELEVEVVGKVKGELSSGVEDTLVRVGWAIVEDTIGVELWGCGDDRSKVNSFRIFLGETSHYPEDLLQFELVELEHFGNWSPSAMIWHRASSLWYLESTVDMVVSFLTTGCVSSQSNSILTNRDEFKVWELSADIETKDNSKFWKFEISKSSSNNDIDDEFWHDEEDEDTEGSSKLGTE